MSLPPLHDVLILGAGPAGLAVATALARQLYTTLVFDSGRYRNAHATHMHNVLGFDHVPPAQYRAAARRDLGARYAATTTFADVAVRSVEALSLTANIMGNRHDDDEAPPSSRPRPRLLFFRAVDAEGREHLGRRVVLATGVRDVVEGGIPGFADCWAKGGIFHCLFCHGFEEKGAPSVGVLATGMVGSAPAAVHVSLMAKQLAGRVNVYTHGNEALAKELGPLLKRDTFTVDSRPIASLGMGDKGSEIILTFDSGEQVTEGFLTNAPKSEINGPFVQQLGIEVTEMGDIKTSQPFQETNIPGVHAVGDIATPMKAVPMAVAQGVMCAAGVVASLGAEKNPSPEEVAHLLSRM